MPSRGPARPGTCFIYSPLRKSDRPSFICIHSATSGRSGMEGDGKGSTIITCVCCEGLRTLRTHSIRPLMDTHDHQITFDDVPMGGDFFFSLLLLLFFICSKS